MADQQSGVEPFNQSCWNVRDGYRNQYQRAYRWLNRLKHASQGQFVFPNNDHNLVRDILLTFFINSFSIRDWLKDEPNWPELEKLLNVDPFFLICRDIANTAKHLKLSNESVAKDIGFATRVDSYPHQISIVIPPGKIVELMKKLVSKAAKQSNTEMNEEALMENLKEMGFPMNPHFPAFLDAIGFAGACLLQWEMYMVSLGFLTEAELQKLKDTAFNHQGF